MQTLTFYLLQQAAKPLIIITALITGLVWAFFSLRILEDILLYTNSFFTLATLSTLLLPTVLTLSIPFSLTITLLYLLNHLSARKEIVVMTAAGISPWQIAKPFLLLAALLTCLLVFLNLYASPASGRYLRTQLQNIKQDVFSFSFQTGVLHNITNNITVFLHGRSEDGSFQGLFLHDSRNPDEVITYTAKSAFLSPQYLIMHDGNIQFTSPSKQTVAMAHFDQYTYNLANFRSYITPKAIYYRHSERYLSELFSPDEEVRRRQLVNRFAVTGHQRLITPLHTFAYTLIILAFFLTSHYNRQQRTIRTILGTTTAICFYLLHIGLSYLTLGNLALAPFIYLLPLLAILISAFALMPPTRHITPHKQP